MKKPTIVENSAINNQKDMESIKEWINGKLKTIHRKMVELFQVDFDYFSDIKILKQSDILIQLTQRMQNDLKENGVVYSASQWKRIRESLSKNRIPGFLENFAFYNPKDDVLYINEIMTTSHPEKIIPVCTHELSEKLLSTYLSVPLKKPARAVVEAYIKAKKTNNIRKLHEFFNGYTDIIFESILKEGICEALALQTLRHIDSETKVASLEKDLEIGHSKCIDSLFKLDNLKRKIEKKLTQLDEKEQRMQTLNEERLIKEALRSSQSIKGISYYLGYPLAKAIVEKYGIRGVKLSLEEYPPLRAQYFANPQAYLTLLEKMTKSIK